MPSELRSLAEGFLVNPVRVEAAPAAATPLKIDQRAERIEGAAKRARLASLLRQPGMGRVIVFTRTKRGADRVGENLGKDGIEAGVIHGNKAQNARQKVLGAFRAGTVPVLVATDIVARGIDVPGISHVINFDLPDEPESYVHRIGRTGRNGASGTALTLVAPDEMKKLRAIEKLTGVKLVEGRDGQGHDAQGPAKAAPKGRGAGKARPPRWRGKGPARRAA